MGQSVGPVFGGIISQYLSFHAIFWFLSGLGGLTLLLVLIFLPETLRSVAGNGTIVLKGLRRPLTYNYKPFPAEPRRPKHDTQEKSHSPQHRGTSQIPLRKRCLHHLFFGAIVYTTWSMVTSSRTALFQEPFALNDLQVDLVFLPNGAGCVAGSYLTGYLIDYDYKTVEKRYRQEKGISPDVTLNKKELVDFPIQRSRMRKIWWIVLIFVMTTALYGYSLSLKMLPVPLILQFFIAHHDSVEPGIGSGMVYGAMWRNQRKERLARKEELKKWADAEKVTIIAWRN